MKVNTRTPQRSFAPAYRKEKITRAAIDRLKQELPLLLDRTANVAESEENHKGHFLTFLRETWYREADCLIAPKGRIDLVIHNGPKAKDDAGVLIEAKRGANRAEMFHPEQPNCKALRELVLYFLRERQAGNTGVKTLMITDVDAVYLFADREFERLFWEKKRFCNKVLAADADPGKTNATAYEIIGQHLDDLDDTLECTVVHLPLFRKYCEDGDPETDVKLLSLYKILSPVHLLRRPFAGDSNHLDKGFYRELLHIIGLEEIGVDSKGKVKRNGGKKIIRRATGDNRHAASLLENVLQVAGRDNRLDRAPDFRSYGNDLEERRFGVALELCTTWVNRVLFLKLLESQLLAYHHSRSSDASFALTQSGKSSSDVSGRAASSNASARSIRFLTPQRNRLRRPQHPVHRRSEHATRGAAKPRGRLRPRALPQLQPVRDQRPGIRDAGGQRPQGSDPPPPCSSVHSWHQRPRPQTPRVPLRLPRRLRLLERGQGSHPGRQQAPHQRQRARARLRKN
ncbi:MAG: hypothetical protein AAF840_04410 [Bacteroidota bacterium]